MNYINLDTSSTPVKKTAPISHRILLAAIPFVCFVGLVGLIIATLRSPGSSNLPNSIAGTSRDEATIASYLAAEYVNPQITEMEGPQSIRLLCYDRWAGIHETRQTAFISVGTFLELTPQQERDAKAYRVTFETDKGFGDKGHAAFVMVMLNNQIVAKFDPSAVTLIQDSKKIQIPQKDFRDAWNSLSKGNAK